MNLSSFMPLFFIEIFFTQLEVMVSNFLLEETWLATLKSKRLLTTTNNIFDAYFKVSMTCCC